jgi:hypothetical protein
MSNHIYNSFFDSTKYSILTHLRTGNVFYDTIITTMCISLFTYFFNKMYDINHMKFLSSIYSLFYKKNSNTEKTKFIKKSKMSSNYEIFKKYNSTEIESRSLCNNYEKTKH